MWNDQISQVSSALGQCSTVTTAPPPSDTIGSKLRVLLDASETLALTCGRIHALHFGARPDDAAKNPQSTSSISEALTLANVRLSRACELVRDIEREISQ